jgi:hypothetical protein
MENRHTMSQAVRAFEFAKAAAMRPRIVGAGLQQIARDPEIFRGLFDNLEAQKILEGNEDITLVPPGNEVLKQLTAAAEEQPRVTSLTKK